VIYAEFLLAAGAEPLEKPCDLGYRCILYVFESYLVIHTSLDYRNGVYAFWSPVGSANWQDNFSNYYSAVFSSRRKWGVDETLFFHNALKPLHN
jgi:hypothetical protein